mmetsp:Transcript_16770/g.56336  ORF Transcript_16770/g.56336 Transcript_16770/m.56336 type:complete len:215 (+) Transcript_16770:83-727(+)
MAERELVPFFPADGGAGEASAAQPDEKSGARRKNRKKGAKAGAEAAPRPTPPKAPEPAQSSKSSEPKGKSKKTHGKETSTPAKQDPATDKKASPAQRRAQPVSDVAAAAAAAAFAGGAFEQSPDPRQLPQPKRSFNYEPPRRAQALPFALDAAVTNEEKSRSLCSLLGVESPNSVSAVAPVIPEAKLAEANREAVATDAVATQQLCTILGLRAC